LISIGKLLLFGIVEILSKVLYAPKTATSKKHRTNILQEEKHKEGHIHRIVLVFLTANVALEMIK